MKKITALILSLICLTSFAQSIESVTQKISDQICNCISEDIASYSEIKPEFNRCYDKEFNQIFDLVDSEEHSILLQAGALEEVKNGIIPTLNRSCEKIRRLIQAEMENAADSASNEHSAPCPTNFTGKDVNKIRKRDGKIAAFNGLVVKVHKADNGNPYYQVKLEGGNTVWVSSLINSGFEEERKILRILGYVSQVGDDKTAKKCHEIDHHVLAFCVIDLESKQMATMPGSEIQVKEWMEGKIPQGKR